MAGVGDYTEMTMSSPDFDALPLEEQVESLKEQLRRCGQTARYMVKAVAKERDEAKRLLKYAQMVIPGGSQWYQGPNKPFHDDVCALLAPARPLVGPF